jgi:DNA invertase Pin-like site-specific DNA recombinase
MTSKDAGRRKFDIVMAWAIDRLWLLTDLLDTIQHLEACGVDLYLDQQAIDTTTPTLRGQLSREEIDPQSHFRLAERERATSRRSH